VYQGTETRAARRAAAGLGWLHYDRAIGTSTLRIEPLHADFGALLPGVALRHADANTIEAIREAWAEFGLLVFPAQYLTRAEQDSFARHFGELEVTAIPLTNITADGTLRDVSEDLSKSLQGNERWHHDSTFMPVQAKGAVFTAEIIPSCGGDTGFADMRRAYERLDDETRERIAGLAAYHSRQYSMERAGFHITKNADGAYELYGYHDDEPPLRPLVKLHPDTGRPNLVIGQHAFGIPGLTSEESVALLDRLNVEACPDDATYHHRWTVGDAILWDNRRLMHRATPHDPHEPRRMWHTRIAGDPATETALNYPAR
jgi:alpha-ketoglutarate-dependent taurine dioxygenase